MIALEFPFTRSGYRHVLLARVGRWCVVERTWIESGEPMLCHYEIVRLRQRPTTHWSDGTETPAHEAYPPPSAWGHEGWTLPTLVHVQAYWTERLRPKYPELPGWEQLGIPDDPEQYLAWKEGRLPPGKASARNKGISEGHP